METVDKLMAHQGEVPDRYNLEKLLSLFNTYDKYLIHLPDKERRESWFEAIDRVKIQHLKKFPNIAEEIEWAFQYVYDKKLVPSMRSLQFAGKAILKNEVRLYNCAYLPVSDTKAFRETTFLLLSGVGVGFSVQSHHVNQLPATRIPENRQKFLIMDSIEGWSDAIDAVIKAYLGNLGYIPNFDYTDIRPAGTPLKSSGGLAPGFQKLKWCLDEITTIFEKAHRNHGKLSTLDAHDIMCIIADCVVSGGIRRSACISLFDRNDMAMLTAKSGDWGSYPEYRGRANNSIVLERSVVTEEEFRKLWVFMKESGSGEPGFLWVEDRDMGTNPCAEISLQPHTFCNLCDVSIADIGDDNEEFFNRIKAAAIIGTVQATYTDFHYLSNRWKIATEKSAQIGVSITGICDNSKYQSLDYKTAAKEYAQKVNAELSAVLGINQSVASTTVKPSGNAAVVLSTSSGVHARHSKFYFRRMSINKNRPIYAYLKNINPALVEEHLTKIEEAFIKVPIKVQDGALVREDETAIDFLNRVKFLQQNWIVPGHREGANMNNVSSTVSIREDEYDICEDWFWENRAFYNGIACLPYDTTFYTQVPFEDITEEVYLASVKEIYSYLEKNEIVFTDIKETIDGTDHLATAGCEGMSCDINAAKMNQ